MRNISLFIGILFFNIGLSFGASEVDFTLNKKTILSKDSLATAFADSLKKLRTGYDHLLLNWDDPHLLRDDLVSRPNFYKLITPATYYKAPLYEAINIDGWKPSFFWEEKDPYRMFNRVPDIEKSKRVDTWINRQLLYFYLTYPSLVSQNEEKIQGLKAIPKELSQKVDAKSEEVLKFAQEIPDAEVLEAKLLVLKPNFWKKSGNGFLQFTQTSLSDNWYKGGESTLALLAGLVLQMNYDDKQKIQWDNTIEWRLGLITSPSDTLHKYKVNNDVLRFSSKLGYRAVTNFYYTLSAEVKTQLFSNYASNSNKLLSSLLSPAELNVGIGMDYKYVKDKVCNLSVLINPLNYTLYSVWSNRVDPTRFNIPEGKMRASVVGSRAEAILKWRIMNSLMWESRFSYITNYQKSIGEWENTFSFAFNRFLSTKLFMLARFDDGASNKGKYGYFQYQELLSFGLNYVW